MIRQAGPADAAAMTAFLVQDAETTMFLTGNLAAHGTQERTHRHGTRFYLAEREGNVVAVGGITNGGMVMCHSADVPERFHRAFADVLSGCEIQGMTGAPAQVRAVFDALGCQGAAFSLREVTPLYAMRTADLEGDRFAKGTLVRPAEADIDWLGPWFQGFEADTGLMPLGGTDGAEAARGFVAHADTRVLQVAGVPVAMSAFNARTQDTVQVGGVYVPPAYRGRGYGGLIVAKQLIEARAAGIKRAILFAASDVAARAYELIGFRRAGSYEIALFATPWRGGA